MSTQTNKLGLFKYDPIVDKEELFDIQEALNDNWDKIDNSIPVIVDVEVVDSSTGKYKLVNHTYAELVEKLESGIAMLLKQPLNNNCFRYLNGGMRYTDTLELAFFVMQNNGQLFRALVKADDSVEILSWNFVNANRTINGHNLKANITLTAADVGAATIEEVAETVSELLGIAIGGSY